MTENKHVVVRCHFHAEIANFKYILKSFRNFERSNVPDHLIIGQTNLPGNDFICSFNSSTNYFSSILTRERHKTIKTNREQTCCCPLSFPLLPLAYREYDPIFCMLRTLLNH
jgi:hypothetical protein